MEGCRPSSRSKGGPHARGRARRRTCCGPSRSGPATNPSSDTASWNLNVLISTTLLPPSEPAPKAHPAPRPSLKSHDIDSSRREDLYVRALTPLVRRDRTEERQFGRVADRATGRDHRRPEPSDEPGAPGPRLDPPGLRRQGRHTAVHPDRVHMEWVDDRDVHREERREGPGATTQPGGRPDHRHRGAPAQDPAHPRTGRAGRRRGHPGGVPGDERHLHDDARATGRVGGRGAFALRRHGPDRRRADVGEADRLRDDPPERGCGAGPGSGTNVSAPERRRLPTHRGSGARGWCAVQVVEARSPCSRARRRRARALPTAAPSTPRGSAHTSRNGRVHQTASPRLAPTPIPPSPSRSIPRPC